MYIKNKGKSFTDVAFDEVKCKLKWSVNSIRQVHDDWTTV